MFMYYIVDVFVINFGLDFRQGELFFFVFVIFFFVVIGILVGVNIFGDFKVYSFYFSNDFYISIEIVSNC